MSFTAQITADIGGFEASLNKAGEKLKQFQKDVDDGIAGISHIGKSIEGIGKKLSVVSAALTVAGGAAYKMAADFEDAAGATDQIFKDASQSIKGWADGLGSQFGIAKKEALEYSNLMGSMLINIGKLTEEEAAKQSAALIELSGDLTAMFGGSTQDAVRALTGALKGNNTMLDNYGMAVNEALIKARAFELGLIRQGEELSLQAKQAATLSLIFEQTGAAQGQAAREAEGASGSMRSLRVEITSLSTEIGEKLLPVITPIVVKIREIVSVIRNMSPEMLSLSVAIAGIAAASGPILLVIGKVVQMLPAIKVGLASIKTAMIALTGPVAAITLALAAVTAGIVYFANRAKEAVTVSGALSNVNKQVEASIRSEKAELNMLLSIATDETKSKESRLEAIKKINAISPKYLGSITLETVKTNEAKRAVENYTTAIEKNARQKAISEKIVQLYSKQLEYEEKIARETQKIEEDKAKGFFNSNVIMQSAFKLRRSEFQNELKNVNASIKIYESLGVAVKEVTEAGGDAADSLATQGKTLETLTGKSKAFNDTVKELFKDGSDIYAVVRQVSDSITVLTQRLEGLRNGTIKVKNVAAEIERLEKEIKELNAALKQLTGDRDLNINLKVSGGAEMWDSVMKKVTKPVITPTIDVSKIKTGMGQLKEIIQKEFIDLSSTITSATTSLARNIGDAWGGKAWDDLGANLIKSLGNLAQQLGEQVIAFGVAGIALKKLMMNPYLAIAAGAALVALGSAASAAASRTMSGATGGGYSGGTSSYTSVTSPGLSEYRGQWYDDFNVEFKIKADTLVGVLDTAQQRRRRT